MKKFILFVAFVVVSFSGFATTKSLSASKNTANTLHTQATVAPPMSSTYTLFIELYNGNSVEAEARFLFMEGLSLGLDPGYDAGAYDQETAISSRLPQEDQGVNFELNAMGTNAVFNQIAPLVVFQEAGQAFRISISNTTLPENVNAYIEDTELQTYTNLLEQDFELTAQEDITGPGRFYIHFTTETLGNDVLNTNNVFDTDTVSVFKASNQDFISIAGIAPVATSVTARLYNIIGSMVSKKTLHNPTQTQKISTQGLAKGVYVVQLKAGNALFSKKVLVQ